MYVHFLKAVWEREQIDRNDMGSIWQISEKFI